MERAVQVFAIVNFVVIGVSHVVRPRVWVDFFVRIRAHGEAGVFAVAFLSLIFGSIVVAFHPVWSGIPLVLTLVGWAQVVKALLYFTFPAYGLRKLQIPSPERPGLFALPGVVFLAFAGLLGWHLATVG
jgi:hypothetical protein